MFIQFCRLKMHSKVEKEKNISDITEQMKVLPPPNIADQSSQEGFQVDAYWSGRPSIIWKPAVESVRIRKFKKAWIRNWKSFGRFEKWWTNNKSEEAYRPSDEYFEGRWGRGDCRQTDNRSNSQWRKAIHSLLLFYLV